MKEKTTSDKCYIEISNQVTPEEFELIKDFVLKKGDRRTYRNFDSHNPHYTFKGFDIYFGAEVGQRNTNNDPAISDFNQLIIRDNNASIQYYELIIVRRGDVENNRNWLHDGMSEGNVYLVSVYTHKLESMQKNLTGYLEQIRSELRDH